MKMWMPGRLACSTARERAVDVLLAGARQPEDDRLRHRVGDPPHGLEVALRRGREAGLDDVDAELLELARDHQLLLDVHGRARRLLAVAQRGVEDLYSVHRGSPFLPRRHNRSRASCRGPETRKPRAVASARGPALVGARVPLSGPWHPRARRGRAGKQEAAGERLDASGRSRSSVRSPIRRLPACQARPAAAPSRRAPEPAARRRPATSAHQTPRRHRGRGERVRRDAEKEHQLGRADRQHDEQDQHRAGPGTDGAGAARSP